MNKLFASLLCAAVLSAPVAYGQQQRAKAPTSQKESVILKKGAMLPAASRGAAVKESEYKQRKLKTPGKGQQWVKIKGTYVLINRSTGQINALGR